MQKWQPFFYLKLFKELEFSKLPSWQTFRITFLVCSVLYCGACGVKGPPLPPIDKTLTPEQIEAQERRKALREEEEEYGSEGGYGKWPEDFPEDFNAESTPTDSAETFPPKSPSEESFKNGKLTPSKTLPKTENKKKSQKKKGSWPEF